MEALKLKSELAKLQQLRSELEELLENAEEAKNVSCLVHALYKECVGRKNLVPCTTLGFPLNIYLNIPSRCLTVTRCSRLTCATYSKPHP